MKIYIASKTRHAERWKIIRGSGVPINSTWIDEAGTGESQDLSDLGSRCIKEAAEADVLILYGEPGEKLKGALIEMGAALAHGRTVFVVGNNENFTGALFEHPLVQVCGSVYEG
jgi:hypothetical protein